MCVVSPLDGPLHLRGRRVRIGGDRLPCGRVHGNEGHGVWLGLEAPVRSPFPAKLLGPKRLHRMRPAGFTVQSRSTETNWSLAGIPAEPYDE